MTRPGPDYPHKRPRQTANSDVGAPPQAGASIVIPIRLQVTGPTLGDIVAYKQSLIEALSDDPPRFNPVRLALRHHVTVHQITIDEEQKA